MIKILENFGHSNWVGIYTKNKVEGQYNSVKNTQRLSFFTKSTHKEWVFSPKTHTKIGFFQQKHTQRLDIFKNSVLIDDQDSWRFWTFIKLGWKKTQRFESFHQNTHTKIGFFFQDYIQLDDQDSWSLDIYITCGWNLTNNTVRNT